MVIGGLCKKQVHELFQYHIESVLSDACSKLRLAGRFHLGCQLGFMSSGCLGCLEKDSKVESRLSQVCHH